MVNGVRPARWPWQKLAGQPYRVSEVFLGDYGREIFYTLLDNNPPVCITLLISYDDLDLIMSMAQGSWKSAKQRDFMFSSLNHFKHYTVVS